MNGLLKRIHMAAMVIAKASSNNPVLALVVTCLFFLAFNSVEAMIETLVWGGPFLHWLDPIFAVIWMAFAGLVTWHCAANNMQEPSHDDQ